MPLSRRQIYRRRRIVVFGGLALVLAGTIYATSTLTAPVPATAATLTQPTPAAEAAVQPVWPGFGRGAVGAVGFDGVLAANGDQSAVPIASITKVITALVVLDAKPIPAGESGPSIEYTDADVDIYYDEVAQGASVAPVRSGLVLTEKQSLTMMLLPSAGNYSVSLANWAYGSVDAYLAAATAWLAAHGLDDTRVVDTSGLSDGNTSTPADLVDLAKLANTDDTVASIVSQPSAEIPGVGVVTNTNKMLGGNGVDGIKTGTTTEAGACLMFSGDYVVGTKTVTIVGVLLGGPGMLDHGELNAAIATLLGSVVPGFHDRTLVTAGDPFGSYTSAWGDSAQAVAATTATTLLWSDTPISATASAEPVTVAQSGDEVGSVTYTVGTDVFDVPLVLDGGIQGPDAMWRLSNPGELSG